MRQPIEKTGVLAHMFGWRNIYFILLSKSNRCKKVK